MTRDPHDATPPNATSPDPTDPTSPDPTSPTEPHPNIPFAGKDWRALGYLGSGCGPWATQWHVMQGKGGGGGKGGNGEGEGSKGEGGEQARPNQPAAAAPATAAPPGSTKACTALLPPNLISEHEALFGLSEGRELSRQLR